MTFVTFLIFFVENDKLGLVLFNHQSQKLLDLTYTTNENKKKISSLIDTINARGGTYILGGLEIAVNMLKSSANTPKSNSQNEESKSVPCTNNDFIITGLQIQSEMLKLQYNQSNGVVSYNMLLYDYGNLLTYLYKIFNKTFRLSVRI